MTKYAILAVSVIVLFASCANVKEQFVFDKKGSGTYSMEYDLGSMIGMLDMMGGESSDEPDLDGDMSFPEELENMDTVINFYTGIPDSLRSQVSNPELMKKVNLSMKSDKENQEMIARFWVDFDNFSELDQIMSEFQNLRSGDDMQSSLMQNQPFLPADGFSNRYTKKKRSFAKKEHAFDMSKLTDELDTEISLGEMGGMMEMMFAGSEFVTVIKTPKKIKKVECDCAHKILDKKTVQLEFQMSDLIKSGKMPAYSVVY